MIQEVISIARAQWQPALAALLMLQTTAGAAAGCEFALLNANVWTGAAYEKRSIGVKDGRFAATTEGLPPVEASSLYLIPPFADAHNHRIDTPFPGDTSHSRALTQGIFYALNPNNIRPDGPTRTGQAGLVDVQAAGGGLTRPLGHPQPIYDGLAAQGMLGALKAADLPGQAFHLVTTPEEARAAVSKVKANGASIIKLYLLDHDRPGGGDGLSAANFDVAVAEAGRLGLRPIVHVESAADFRRTVAARVHALVHLPYLLERDRDTAELLLTAEDAAMAAANGVHVVPTVAIAHVIYDGEKLARMQTVQRHNLRLLREAKVIIGLGADRWALDLHGELAYIRALAIFDTSELVQMATLNGARIAFPGRKIGMISPGYEASFLASFRPLPGGWSEAREPALGVREGRLLIDSAGLLTGACGRADLKRP